MSENNARVRISFLHFRLVANYNIVSTCGQRTGCIIKIGSCICSNKNIISSGSYSWTSVGAKESIIIAVVEGVPSSSARADISVIKTVCEISRFLSYSSSTNRWATTSKVIKVPTKGHVAIFWPMKWIKRAVSDGSASMKNWGAKKCIWANCYIVWAGCHIIACVFSDCNILIISNATTRHFLTIKSIGSNSNRTTTSFLRE